MWPGRRRGQTGDVSGAYEERPAAAIPDAVVWCSVADGDRRVLPDGCSDLMLLGDRLVIAGPDTAAHISALAPGTSLVGIRFAPGWGPCVFGVPADEVRDQRVALDELWAPSGVRSLEARLLDADLVDRGPLLERIAADRLADAGTGPDRIVVAAARRLGTGESVDTVAGAVGVSPRQLRRLAHESFGYGPKLLARILRLGRALDLVRAGRPPAAAAAETGYVDQAHLSRDVKDLTGTTLRGLLAPRVAA